MGMRCCACSLTPILAVAGLLGLGAAGYRVAGGGCPFCHHDNAAATTQVSAKHEQIGHTKLVGAEGKPAGCAGMTEAECKDKMAECPAHSGCCDPQNEAKKADAPQKVATTGK